MGYFLCAESWEYLGFFRTHINYARFTKEHWKLREREIRIAFCTLREILSRFQRFEATKINIRSVAQRLRNDEHGHIHCSVPSLIYVFMHVSELSSGERNNIWCTSFSEASLNEGSTNEAQRNVPFLTFVYATRMIITHQAIYCSVREKYFMVSANTDSL